VDSESIPAGADLAEELLARVRVPAEIAGLGRCQYRRLRHREATVDLDRLRADLAADPVLRLAAGRGGPAQTSGPDVVPAQLPTDVYGFAGRVEHLACLPAATGPNAPIRRARPAQSSASDHVGRSRSQVTREVAR
jgi:hypothetical protein